MKKFICGAVILGLCGSNMALHAETINSTDCAPKQYTMAVKYQQSAEIHALQYQAYQLATFRLQAILKKYPHAKNLAIVTDLDETVLDNSALFASDIQKCQDYTTWNSWPHWEQSGQPKLITGSLDFFKYANQHGITIYYITDRSEENRQQTLTTLKALGLPQVKTQQVLLYGQSKQQRRETVAKQHKIVMLLGDTLHDFSNVFNESLSKAEKLKRIDEQRKHFGQDWIVLPNASYGAWNKDELNIEGVN